MKKNEKRVTIKDVAQRAGISIGTVSRYISNRGYVGAEAREKIEKAIEELHYVPNAVARSMINKKSQIIGVAVPEINNPFLADLVVRIESALSKRNYSIMLCNTRYEATKIETFVDDLIMRNAEGIILVSTDVSKKNVMTSIRRFMYGVSVGQRLPEFDCINFNDFEAACEITSHMIELGHERIACMGFSKNASQTMERLYGTIHTLEHNRIPIQSEYLLGYDEIVTLMDGEDSSGNQGYVWAKYLLGLENPPTAIFAINDFYAMGAYEAAYERGLKVGKDISISGFDDINIAKFMTPPLTTVHCDAKEMASCAVDLLMNKIDSEDDETKEWEKVSLKAKFIARKSTGKKI